MPLIKLEDNQSEDLECIKKAPTEVITSLFKLSLEAIRNGNITKGVSKLAKESGLTTQQLQLASESISNFLLEGARLNLNNTEFKDSLALVNDIFDPSLHKYLIKIYQDHRDEFRLFLSESGVSLPSFNDLEWRLDIQVASRCIRHQVSPQFLLKLDTKNERKEISSQILQCDPSNLKYICNELETALQESKSGYSRRIMRNIK